MTAKARKRETPDVHLPVDREERALQLAFVLAPFAPRVAKIPLWRVGVFLGGFAVLCTWSVVSAVIVSKPYWKPLYAKLSKDGGAKSLMSETASTVAASPVVRAMVPVVPTSPFALPVAKKADVDAVPVTKVAVKAPEAEPAVDAAAVGATIKTTTTTTTEATTTAAPAAATTATTTAALEPSAEAFEAGHSFHAARSVQPSKGGGFLLQDFVASTYAEAINVKFRMAGTSGKLQRGYYTAKATFQSPDGTLQVVEPAGTPGDISYAVRNFADRSHTFARPTPGAHLVSLAVTVKDRPGNVAATFAVDLTAK